MAATNTPFGFSDKRKRSDESLLGPSPGGGGSNVIDLVSDKTDAQEASMERISKDQRRDDLQLPSNATQVFEASAGPEEASNAPPLKRLRRGTAGKPGAAHSQRSPASDAFDNSDEEWVPNIQRVPGFINHMPTSDVSVRIPASGRAKQQTQTGVSAKRNVTVKANNGSQAPASLALQAAPTGSKPKPIRQTKAVLAEALEQRESSIAQVNKQLEDSKREVARLKRANSAKEAEFEVKIKALEQTKSDGKQIEHLQAENLALRDQIMTMVHDEDEVTDDVLAQNMRGLASRITNWVQTHLKDARLVDETASIRISVERAIGSPLPKNVAVNSVPKTHLARAIVAGAILKIFQSSVLIPRQSSRPSAAVAALWHQLDDLPKGAERLASEWATLTYKLFFPPSDASLVGYGRDLIVPLTEDIKSTIQTTMHFCLPTKSINSLCKAFLEAMKLSLILRRQRAKYQVGFPGDLELDPGNLLNFLGTDQVADKSKAIFGIFPGLWKQTAGAKQESNSSVIVSKAWMFCKDD